MTPQTLWEATLLALGKLYGDWQVLALTTLLLAQVMTGIMSAVRKRVFDFTRTSDFLLDHFFPLLLAYGIAKLLAFGLAPALVQLPILPSNTLDALPLIAWSALMLRTLGFVFGNLKELGLDIPALPGTTWEKKP